MSTSVTAWPVKLLAVVRCMGESISELEGHGRGTRPGAVTRDVDSAAIRGAVPPTDCVTLTSDHSSQCHNSRTQSTLAYPSASRWHTRIMTCFTTSHIAPSNGNVDTPSGSRSNSYVDLAPQLRMPGPSMTSQARPGVTTYDRAQSTTTTN